MQDLIELNIVPRLFLALISLTVLPGIGLAEETSSCPYCADWKPLSGHRFLSAELLIIRDDRIALPGCANASVTRLREEQQYRGGSGAEGMHATLLVYFRLEEPADCSPAVAGAERGALLALQYDPTGSSKGGSIQLRVLRAREISEADRTAASAQWFAVRADEK